KMTEQKHLEKDILEEGIKEQRRIGQDLHDGVGQELTAMGLSAQNLAEILAEKKLTEAATASKLVLGLQAALSQIRNIARGLFPVVNEPAGLMGALHTLAERTTSTSKIKVTFDAPNPVLIEDNNVATHLYRVAQESVSNALRHAQPQNIRIALNREDG